MKIDNELLAQYLEIEGQLKLMEKQYEIIKTLLKEKGSFSTSHYVVCVEERERTSLPGVKEMVKLIGADLVLPHVRTTVSKYVSVSLKEAKKA